MGCSPSVLLEHIHLRDSSSSSSHAATQNSAAGAAVTTGLLSATTQEQRNNHHQHHHVKKERHQQQVRQKKSNTTSTLSDSQSKRKNSTVYTTEDETIDSRVLSGETQYGLLLPPSKHLPKCLMVCSKKDDSVFECIRRGSERAGFESSSCHGYETALEQFQTRFHDLVIVDTRHTKFDADTLCRSIRNTKGSQSTVIVAVVKKSVFEKEDSTVLSLLDAGFNRCLIESTNIYMITNELIQVKNCDVRTQIQLATTQALYAALDQTKDLVHITDDVYHIQYVNRSSERYLGYRQDELIGKPLLEQLIQDAGNVSHMNGTLQKYREWSGPLLCKRKTADPVHTQCHVVPVCTMGRVPSHYIFVQEISDIVGGITSSTTTGVGGTGDNNKQQQQQQHPQRGSVHSLRRGSFDVRSIGSDNMRRTSLAKLHAMPLEAPITKVISLICTVQESASAPSIQMLDKVIDMLQSSELYSPQMKEDHRVRNEDPVTMDLIGALLTQNNAQNMSSRRSSNDSTVVRAQHTRHLTTMKHKVPAQLKDLLDSTLSWDFDIFRLEELTNRRPLVHVGMNLCAHFEVCSVLNCDEKTLCNWLTVIENHYHADNTYHNSTHATDVLQATAVFLEKERMKSIMEPLDEVTSLLAAIAHDIDHPGKSSAFLSNSNHILAVLYNDISILESHHAAITFKLTLSDDRVNIFKNLDREQYKIARHNVIDMILATEMTRHFEHLAKFVNVFCTKSVQRDDANYISDSEEMDFTSIALPENIQLVKRMMIKCADVSNPTRPLRSCIEWARRIAEEYFNQTDEEIAHNLPVVMPMFDRTSCSVPKSQIGFVDFIINDMFEAWDAFIDMPELISHMRYNYTKWKEYEEQGLTTLHDIKKLMSTVTLNPRYSNTPTTPE